MTQHTPGPWRINNDYTVLAGEASDIADVWGHDNADNVLPVKANARLITAAPDMFAAIQAYLEYSEPNLEGEPILMKIRNQMRAAIAKATEHP